MGCFEGARFVDPFLIVPDLPMWAGEAGEREGASGGKEGGGARDVALMERMSASRGSGVDLRELSSLGGRSGSVILSAFSSRRSLSDWDSGNDDPLSPSSPACCVGVVWLSTTTGAASVGMLTFVGRVVEAIPLGRRDKCRHRLDRRGATWRAGGVGAGWGSRPSGTEEPGRVLRGRGGEDGWVFVSKSQR
jgi:hypothetical protein